MNLSPKNPHATIEDQLKRAIDTMVFHSFMPQNQAVLARF
jgi:hypothetical protein